MTSNPSQAGSHSSRRLHPPIYPAYTFSASPTYNVWVKLTCADLCALRAEPAFIGQNLYFHLNHPIRYVRLVGTVVAHEKIYDKLHLLTLDDGSGATVDIRVPHAPIPSISTACDKRKDGDDGEDSAAETAQDESMPVAPDKNLNVVHATSIPHLTLRTTTAEPLLTLYYTPPRTASCANPKSIPLHPGTCIKAKGTLSLFRHSLQLDLKRVSLIRSTAEEVRCWTEIARFYEAVLMRPWLLAESEIAALERGERVRVEEGRAVARERAERSRKRKERREIAQAMRDRAAERAERKRRREERVMDAGALDANA